jgi:hypothetical protein
MMPFLIVSAVLAPTVIAPNISKIVPKTIACLYEMDLDDTLVAQALATSSERLISSRALWGDQSEPLTGTIVEGIEHSKERPNDEDVGILVEHLDGFEKQARLCEVCVVGWFRMLRYRVSNMRLIYEEA